MDGISVVTARISEIRALLHPAPAMTAAPTGTTPAPSWGPATAPTASGGTSFADALRSAVASPPTQALPVADLKARYTNGRIPADRLQPIGTGEHRLAAPAAAAFGDLQAAARRNGITIGVTDSYRSYDAQVDVARRKGLYAQGGLAAQPGTSQHGWGLALDLDLDDRAQTWMRINAARFGFVEDTPREPWHWAFKG